MDYLDSKKNRKWVRLQATKLQTFNRHYKRYIDYLENQGIIKVDPRYLVGERTKWYRINNTNYLGAPLEIPIVDDSIRKKVRKQLQTSASKCRGYHHLTKWFDDKLTIDRIAADAWTNENLGRIYINQGSIGGYLNRPYRERKWTRNLRAIIKLDKQAFYYKVDDNIGRFHSNITNLRKELRNFLRYDGKRLVNVDIRNSQPFFAGVLLQEAFYRKGERLSIWMFQELFNDTKYEIEHKVDEALSIILGISRETHASGELQKYLQSIQEGKFYELLSEILYPSKSFNKAKVKEDAFILFFAKNGSERRKKKKIKAFQEKLPLISSVFMTFKKNHHATLSHILQRVESHIVIENASRRIAAEKPDLPIFTIHDSIATIEGNEEYVESVLREEVMKVTKLSVSIGKEIWGIKEYDRHP